MVAPGKRDYPAQRRARRERAVIDASMRLILKPIPGFEGRYGATADGRIWSHLTYAFLNPSLASDRHGQPMYLMVVLRVDGRSVNCRVHRLICAAFHGVPARGMEANHVDLVKTNNASSNLEWLTPKQNSQHAWANLPLETTDRMRRRVSETAKATGHLRRKLSPESVLAARAMLADGRTHAETAIEFGVCRSTISHLAAGTFYHDQA